MNLEMTRLSKGNANESEGKLEAKSKEELKPFLEVKHSNEVATEDQKKSPTH
jgi:hypothetical protein